MKTKVVMVDDHLMIIEGMRKQLASIPYIDLVDYTSNPEEVIKMLETKEPEVVIFDYELPVMNGYELLVEIKKISPDVKTICFTMHGEPWILQRLIKAGVNGIVLKTDKPDTLNKAIETIINGKKFIPHGVMANIINSNAYSIDNITDREIEVLRHIAAELSTKEIADKMNLSENTIESYRKNLMLKLNAKNMAGLVLKGFQLGII